MQHRPNMIDHHRLTEQHRSNMLISDVGFSNPVEVGFDKHATGSDGGFHSPVTSSENELNCELINQEVGFHSQVTDNKPELYSEVMHAGVGCHNHVNNAEIGFNNRLSQAGFRNQATAKSDHRCCSTVVDSGTDIYNQVSMPHDRFHNEIPNSTDGFYNQVDYSEVGLHHQVENIDNCSVITTFSLKPTSITLNL